MNHESYIRRCFQLASQGAGKVAPNPMVGAVVVHQDQVMAEGFHHQFGDAHAEVVALNQISGKVLPADCILYVNLEPCSHTGKTPPCTERILSKKVGKVVISNRDPFPLVNGSGVAELVEAGIQVTEKILEEEGSWLNRRFITFHKLRRPYIT